MFLVGDLYALIFLPVWCGVAAGETGEGDAAQMLAACFLLLLLTLALRLAAAGLGLAVDRRVLGTLEHNTLVWGQRRIPYTAIAALTVRTAPLARLFRRAPSGLLLELDGEKLLLPHAPRTLALALTRLCPNARRRPNRGFWLVLGAVTLAAVGVSVWLGAA